MAKMRDRGSRVCVCMCQAVPAPLPLFLFLSFEEWGEGGEFDQTMLLMKESRIDLMSSSLYVCGFFSVLLTSPFFCISIL